MSWNATGSNSGPIGNFVQSIEKSTRAIELMPITDVPDHGLYLCYDDSTSCIRENILYDEARESSHLFTLRWVSTGAAQIYQREP